MCPEKEITVFLLLCLLPSVVACLIFCISSWLFQTLHGHVSIFRRNTQRCNLKRYRKLPRGSDLNGKNFLPVCSVKNHKLLYIKWLFFFNCRQIVDSAQLTEPQAFAFDAQVPATRCETRLPPHVGCAGMPLVKPTNMLVQVGADRVQSITTPNNRAGWQRRVSRTPLCNEPSG